MSSQCEGENCVLIIRGDHLQQIVMTTLETIMEEESLCDVHFWLGDDAIKISATVLAAISDVWRRRITDVFKQDNAAIMHTFHCSGDCHNSSILHSVKQLIYLGKTNIESTKLEQFMEILMCLGINMGVETSNDTVTTNTICLTNFKDRFIEGLQIMGKNQICSDLFIIVEGYVIKAHRLVFGGSSVLQRAFRQLPGCRRLYVMGSSVDTVQTLITYLYYGFVDLIPNCLNDFSKLSSVLGLKLTSDHVSSGEEKLTTNCLCLEMLVNADSVQLVNRLQEQCHIRAPDTIVVIDKCTVATYAALFAMLCPPFHAVLLQDVSNSPALILLLHGQYSALASLSTLLLTSTCIAKADDLPWILDQIDTSLIAIDSKKVEPTSVLSPRASVRVKFFYPTFGNMRVSKEGHISGPLREASTPLTSLKNMPVSVGAFSTPNKVENAPVQSLNETIYKGKSSSPLRECLNFSFSPTSSRDISVQPLDGSFSDQLETDSATISSQKVLLLNEVSVEILQSPKKRKMTRASKESKTKLLRKFAVLQTNSQLNQLNIEMFSNDNVRKTRSSSSKATPDFRVNVNCDHAVNVGNIPNKSSKSTQSTKPTKAKSPKEGLKKSKNLSAKKIQNNSFQKVKSKPFSELPKFQSKSMKEIKVDSEKSSSKEFYSALSKTTKSAEPITNSSASNTQQNNETHATDSLLSNLNQPKMNAETIFSDAIGEEFIAPQNSEFLSCKVCFANFESQFHLEEHCMSHNDIKCIFCGLMFMGGIDLQKHLGSHLQNDMCCLCPKCQSPFASKELLTYHKRYCRQRSRPKTTVEKDVKGGTFYCQTCGKLFVNEGLLGIHAKSCVERSNSSVSSLEVKNEKMNLLCPVCHLHFISQAMLDEHKKIHNSASQLTRTKKASITKSRKEPFSCFICGCSFRRSNSRNKHSRVCAQKCHILSPETVPSPASVPEKVLHIEATRDCYVSSGDVGS